MFDQATIIHLIAGGVGGTAGALVTCPLEVVKTRLQSSVSNFSSTTPFHHQPVATTNGKTCLNHVAHFTTSSTTRASITNPVNSVAHMQTRSTSVGLYMCFKQIIQNEGPRALFKGLGPNIIGVAPSRAIYFCAYAQSKHFLNTQSYMKPDTPLVHICSASLAGFTACTATNPIWFIKTRVQLDTSQQGKAISKCIRQVYNEHGIRGFYKGVTASYMGISETVIHFVIYEALKAKLLNYQNCDCDNHRHSGSIFFTYMAAGAISKTIASIVAYPHEVVRTRLREEGSKYRSFFQTLVLVAREEGHRGLYRGLVTQLIRQIPNTAIMMATYELVVYTLMSDRHQGSSYS